MGLGWVTLPETDRSQVLQLQAFKAHSKPANYQISSLFKPKLPPHPPPTPDEQHKRNDSPRRGAASKKSKARLSEASKEMQLRA